MPPTLGLQVEAGLERTSLSHKEVDRAGVLRRVREGKLNLVNAAQLLGISYRQAKRVWKRYQAHGVQGLKHRGAGKDQQSSQGREVPKARAGTVASQVQWRDRGALWCDAGSRALGERGWDRDPSRNSATVDVGRRFMESGT